MRVDPGARSVVVLRPDNLGDLVLFSASLRHLRATFPRATITLVAKPHARELFEGSPDIDRFSDWSALATLARRAKKYLPKRTGKVGRVARRALFHRYRSDVLLLPVRSPSNGMHEVVRALSAKAKFGISGDTTNQSAAIDRAADDAYTDRMHVPAARRLDHELEVNRDFLAWLGVDVAADDFAPEVPARPADRAWAERTVRGTGGSKVLGICPCGGRTGAKNYPTDAYPEVLRLLGVDELRVVIFGDHLGVEACRVVAHVLKRSGIATSVTNLGGQTNLGQLVEGLRACDAVLSVDAGPLHLAVAIGRPTVGIVGGWHPHRFFPWGDPDRTSIAEHPLDCFDCNGQCPYERRHCVVDLSPLVVAEQLRAVLDAPGSIEWIGT